MTKQITSRDIEAAIAYAADPSDGLYKQSDKAVRDFKLGAYRMLHFLIDGGFVHFAREHNSSLTDEEISIDFPPR